MPAPKGGMPRLRRLPLVAALLVSGCFRAMDPAPGSESVVGSLLSSLHSLTGGDEAADEPEADASAQTETELETETETETAAETETVLASSRIRETSKPAAAGSAVPAGELALGAGMMAAKVGFEDAVPADWNEGAEKGSVRLTEAAVVFADADPGSAELGLVGAGTRIAVRERVIAPGCDQAWLGLAPQGYVCAPFSESKEAPVDHLLPRIPDGRRLPGSYAKVNKGAKIYSTLTDARMGVGGRTPSTSLMVRRQTAETVGGRSFWKTRHGWIATSHLRRFGGSRWEGVHLQGAPEAAEDAPSLPLGWVLPDAMLAKVAVRDTPSSKGKVVRWLSRRDQVALLSTEKTGKYLPLRDGGWVEARSLAVAAATERPEAAETNERWLDIDLSEQTLVAYVGDTPVFATMISTGRPGHSTPTGVFRLSRKVAERTMNSMADSDDSYSVAKVPWTAYFETGYALHAAYWHDNFGHRKSHGCVNLSPLDARSLYAWTAPLVAPGWAEVYGNVDQPGSVVRIRSVRDPEPKTKGYAADMLEGALPKGSTALAMK